MSRSAVRRSIPGAALAAVVLAAGVAIAAKPAEPPEPVAEAESDDAIVVVEGGSLRVVHPHLIERRMGERRNDREYIRHQGTFSSQHAQPDSRRGRILYSGTSRGRLALYDDDRPSRIRIDGITRRRNPHRIARIRHHGLGGDRRYVRFGMRDY